MRWAWLLLAGCGRIAFDPLVATDASSDAPSGDCVWSAPVALADLNTDAGESEPVLHPDGTRLVFASDRGGIDRLYIATRAGTGWSAAVPFDPFDIQAGDGGPSWNAAGTKLYFSSYYAGPLRLYEAPFDNGLLGSPTLVQGLEGLAESIAPTVRGDELEMFFSTRLPPSRIEYATRSTTASAWTPRGDVPELVASGDHGYPGISGDGLTLYFETQRTGGFVISRTRRESTSQPFGIVEPVMELDAEGSHGDPAPSFDGTELVFASDRADPSNFDLYLSRRLCD